MQYIGYCRGKNCDRRDTCERMTFTGDPCAQIVDWSTEGYGGSSGDGTNSTFQHYCGRGTNYDYYVSSDTKKSLFGNELPDRLMVKFGVPAAELETRLNVIGVDKVKFVTCTPYNDYTIIYYSKEPI